MVRREQDVPKKHHASSNTTTCNKPEKEKTMSTPLDRLTHSRGAFLTFAGIITATTAWMIWGNGDMFPREPDPTGDPEDWTTSALKRWLNNRNLLPNHAASREELLERVKANMRPPPGQ
ncbi:hypothetical protein BC567DRAFT_215167 [Phyllosticta citribraziliensis]